MNQKRMWWLPGLWCVLCVGAAFAPLDTVWTGQTLGFPFVQIGAALRSLSLASPAGNAVALALYIALSLLPLAMLLVWRRKGGLHWEDALLPLLSLMLFAGLYGLINPGLLGDPTGFAGAMVSNVLWGVLLAHLLLRLVRVFREAGMGRLIGWMQAMLWLVELMLLAVVCFGLTHALRLAWPTLGTADRVCLLVRALSQGVPCLLDAVAILFAQRLLDAWRIQRYGAESVACAKRLSAWCVRSLAAAVCLGVFSSLLQLALAAKLTGISLSVELPLGSMGLALAMLLLSRLLAEGKRLRDDNELFV